MSAHVDLDSPSRILPRTRAAGFAQNRWLIAAGVFLVLGLLLIPVYFLNAKKKSTATSVRNLRQWGIALNLHLMDNENLMPQVGGKTPQLDLATAWFNSLPIYLAHLPLANLAPENLPRPGERSLWMDPAAKGSPDSAGFFFSYGMNRFLAPDPRYRPFRIYEVPNPSSTVFLAEVAQPDPGAMPGQVAFRHGTRGRGVAHLLFCDGHVSQTSRAEALRGADPPTGGRDVLWKPAPDSPEPRDLDNSRHSPNSDSP